VTHRLLKPAALVLASRLAAPAFAFDWGASVEESTTGDFPVSKMEQGTVDQSFILRGWAAWSLGPRSTLLVKANLTDTLEVSLAQGNPITNTFSGDLDTLSWTTDLFVVGRTSFRDFDGALLNTTLDGVKGQFRTAVAGVDLDLKGGLGTSALVFKTGSTIAISQDDNNERNTVADLTKPGTLLAPPRLVAYAEAGVPRLVPGQSFRTALAAQLDLRGKVAKADENQNPTDSTAPGAPVSMGYWGVGGSGRITGPFFWSAASWLGLGSSLTPVGTYKPGITPTYPSWKPNLIANAFASADLTVLQPAWASTVAGFGLQFGSWDEDGAYPQNNKASGGSASAYTGWFGISLTAPAVVYNPQPTNLVQAKGYWSVKPFGGTRGLFDSLQVVGTLIASMRPTTNPISDSKLIALNNELYLGTEADVSLQWRPVSDWGVHLSAGTFLPNTAALNRSLEVKALLGLNLSF